MQLADHDSLGTIDNEFATAEHDRNITEVDLFLDRLLAGESHQNTEGPAICQTQLAAFIGIVPRLAKFVPKVFQLDRLVVAFNWKNLPQHALDAFVFSLRRRSVVLKKPIVKPCLNFGEVRDCVAGTTAAEVADFSRLEATYGGSCH